MLWYSKPAAEWIEGMPIGNGRLAAMVMGGVKRERLALNHEWLWKGGGRERDNRPAAHLLPDVQRLLLDGKYEEGTRAGNDAFGGAGGISGKPHRVDPFQPAGDFYFELTHGCIHHYRRALDLREALVTVDYHSSSRQHWDTHFKREYVAHFGLDKIFVRISAGDLPFDCALWLDRLMDKDCALSFSGSPAGLIMEGAFNTGVKFRVQAAVRSKDGVLACQAGRLTATGTTELIVALNIGTNVTGKTTEQECGPLIVPADDWAGLLESHRQAYSRFYGGLELELPLPEPDKPTDRRIEAYKTAESDPALPILFFNFGRYLLCSSSGIGTLPPNLQGKWNEDLNPPWESDYHLDINLEMNYWPAEPGNLPLCMNPLFDLIEKLAQHGQKAARDLFGCRGTWFPITTDAWGRATPEAYGWSVWMGAAPWLAQHLWWHYEYTLDEEFLRRHAYPFLKTVAEFLETYAIRDAAGRLQFVPSQSPENRFTLSGPKFPVSLCVSSALDLELAWDVLTHAIKAGEVLDVDEDKRGIWKELLAHLPALKVGSRGQLLEWNEEFEEVEPGHRHLSHLFGLFPGEQIDPDRTPDLFKAARKSLEIRLSNAGGHTGWSRSWVACLAARMGDGDAAMAHVRKGIAEFAAGSLLDLHPPRIFQIDGNFGGTAAMLEMLIQSYFEEIHLLPALPSCWKAGKVRGLKARGGYTVDIEWAGGRLKEARVVGVRDRPCRLKTAGGPLRVSDAAGTPVPLEEGKGIVTFHARAGAVYTVCPGNASV
ncbi:MAG: glycoside hydrolase family 95 protein [Lentisphaerae bacterium]|nr:glycoside hydrolase family 95 protein [Lentisphaerota bacterium]